MRNLFVLCCLLFGWSAWGDELQFSFGEMAAAGSLTNFHAELLGGGAPPSWKILPNQAPSAFAPLPGATHPAGGGSVLAQTSQDPTDERFPMFIYDAMKFRNFRFTTQFKLVSGVAEQMAGVVFRFQNTSNFYVARVSALGKNIRFYKVVNGVRPAPIGPVCAVLPNTWHRLDVECTGTHITIWLDGQPVMPTLEDTSFAEGKIGFWTKSDAVSYFANANISYTPIIPAAQTIVDTVTRQQPRILGLQIYTLTASNTPAVLASKDPADKGLPGTDAELAAIQKGTISFGRQSGAVFITLPLHDRNGDPIGAVRIQLRSFFGETQDNAVNRARLILNRIQLFGLSAEDLTK